MPAPPRLLVAVFSAPANSAARAVIRRTWGARFKALPGAATVFMLGTSQDSTMHVRRGKAEKGCIHETRPKEDPLLLIWFHTSPFLSQKYIPQFSEIGSRGGSGA
jgi:hypothetical protein